MANKTGNRFARNAIILAIVVAIIIITGYLYVMFAPTEEESANRIPSQTQPTQSPAATQVPAASQPANSPAPSQPANAVSMPTQPKGY